LFIHNSLEMKIAAIIVTIIATLIYSITTYLLLYDPIGRTDDAGTHLLNFFIWFTIPIILWIVYFIMNEIKKPNSNIPSFTNSNLKENTNIYHIQENGATSEPLTYNELSSKKINTNTYVWRKGIEWTKAGDLSELSELFEQNGPPPFDKDKLIDKDKLNNEANDFYGYSDNARIFGISILLFFLCIIIYAILEGMGMVE